MDNFQFDRATDLNLTKECDFMKRQLQGIALILFGILLAVFALFNPRIPILDLYVATFANFASVIVGVLGLFFVFKKEK